MKTLILLAIRFYQVVISRPLHFLAGPAGGCRFTPTCSAYFYEAVKTHGALRGSWLGVRRLLRCQPWGGMGHDPVPPARGCCTPAPDASENPPSPL